MKFSITNVLHAYHLHLILRVLYFKSSQTSTQWFRNAFTQPISVWFHICAITSWFVYILVTPCIIFSKRIIIVGKEKQKIQKYPSNRIRTSDLRITVLTNYSPPLYQLSYRGGWFQTVTKHVYILRALTFC